MILYCFVMFTSVIQNVRDVINLFLQQLSNILKDPESSNNDKFVALELLKNASIAANMVLPGFQYTRTTICVVRGKI